MLCDKCHQNEAMVSIVEIVNGKERTINLCRECAANGAGGGITIMKMPGASFLSGLLASVLGLSIEEANQEIESEEVSDENLKKNNIVCPSCNMTYEEFIKYGTFGCPECYRTFNFLLDGYMKKIQGNIQHTGKKPFYNEETTFIPDLKPVQDQASDDKTNDRDASIAITVDKDSSIDELRAALKRAVAREEYEEAARIRDVIRASEGEKVNG